MAGDDVAQLVLRETRRRVGVDLIGLKSRVAIGRWGRIATIALGKGVLGDLASLEKLVFARVQGLADEIALCVEVGGGDRIASRRYRGCCDTCGRNCGFVGVFLRSLGGVVRRLASYGARDHV